VPSRPVERVRVLVLSGHPGPSLALSAMVVLTAVAGGLRGPRIAVFALGVLAGWLSVGWSNDVADATRDAAAGRRNKPVAAGRIGRRAVGVVAAVALVAGTLLCLALRPWTALLYLVMVGAAWAYNAGLKSTLWSGAMYVIGFGVIPALAASTAPGSPVGRPWALVAAALLGLGGHFANVLPDLAGDRATGVRGLPQRFAVAFGERAVRLAALVLLLAATCVIVFYPPGPRGWLPIAGLVPAVALGLFAVRASGRLPFYLALGLAGVDVLLFALRVTG
jgi:4-hydroxybenzoate polyprenyltransferase